MVKVFKIVIEVAAIVVVLMGIISFLIELLIAISF